MSNLKLNCLYCIDSGLAKLLPSEINFSDNGGALFDVIYYAEAASKNEQTDISAHTSISISSGDRSCGYSGAEHFVSLADYNSRLFILTDSYPYKDNWLNSFYVDQSFLSRVDVIEQVDNLICQRFQVNDDFATYDIPDLNSTILALSIQQDFNVNKSLLNNVSIHISTLNTMVKPWMGLMYKWVGKFALKVVNKTSRRSTNAIKLNSSVLTTLAMLDFSSENWVTAKKRINCKIGSIDNSASSNLAESKQNPIQGLEFFAGGYGFFDKHYFEQRSYAHKQPAAQHHGLTFKIKYGIDF